MKNKLKYLFILLAFLTGLVISTVLYVQSFEFYQDEWGIDISFSSDYLVAIVITICGLVYSLVSLIKDKPFDKSAWLIISSIICFYTLGVFFKGVNKHKEFSSIQNYLYVGLVSLFSCGYNIVLFLETYKNNK